MKKVVKKTKKSIKPAYVVDITNCETATDLKLAFIFAKAENKVPVSTEEIKFVQQLAVEDALDFGDLASVAVDAFCDVCDVIEKAFEPKKPWYKRLWNWITRKK